MANHVGQRYKTCDPHRIGVPPGAPPFFYDGCPVCEQKRADGKVRGGEGPLPARRKRVRRRDPAAVARFAAKMAKVAEGRRRALA